MGFFGIPGSFHVNKEENMLAKASKKRSSSNGWRDFCVTMTRVAAAMLQNGGQKPWVYFARYKTL